MKCPKCGKLWNISNINTDSVYICPYCNTSVNEYRQNERDLGSIILEIEKTYDEEIIRDVARLNALLMDYAPNMSKERKLVINAIKEGVLFQAERGFEEGDDSEIVMKRCVAFLVAEMWITEAAARYAVNVIFSVLGHDMSLPENGTEVVDIGENKEAQLIKGNVSFGTKIDADELREYDSIGYKAFASNDQLVEISIPESIKKIYPKAFLDCSSLKRVTLSRSIQAIGRSAFDGCICLKTLNVDNNPIFTVSNGMLIDKVQKRLIRSTNLNEEKISVVNGVKIICKKAFERLEAIQITIPRSVEEIEEDAFYLTQELQKIDVDALNQKYKSIDGVLHSKDGAKLLRYPQGKKDIAYYLEDHVTTIYKKAFSCTANLVSVTLTGGVKEIGENAFEYCVRIESLILPRSVEIIGERAFQYCEKLASVMFPQGIIRIGDCAFLGCKLLKTVSVPKSVTEIGNMAFAGCKSLAKVVVQENVKYIGDKAFGGCPDVEISIKGNEYVETYCKVHNIKYSKS